MANSYIYNPVKSVLINANMISNSMFATSGASAWPLWTKTSSSLSTLLPDRSNFYTRGVSIQGYHPSSGNKRSVYLTYSNNIAIDKTKKYDILITYKHLSTVKVGYLDLLYFQSNGVTPCATALQKYYLDSSENWKTNFITLYNNTAAYSLRPDSMVTCNAFKIPSDASYVKPRLYFGYDTTQPFKMNFDSIKLGVYDQHDKFNSTSKSRIAIVTQQNLMMPDTPYCKMHVPFNGNANDIPRSITGVLTNTAWYVGTAYFSKFATAIALSSKTKNQIRNGHFSSSLSKGTAHWTNNGLYVFATSHTALFGTRSLKVGATSTIQSVSQSILQPLIGNTIKKFSLYSQPIDSDGFRVRGKLSGVTKWEINQQYTTSNWRRYTYSVSSADTVYIYPSYSDSVSNKTILIDGLMYSSAQNSYSLYYEPYISGTVIKQKNTVSYNLNDFNLDHGTIVFWYSPQFYSTSQDAGILKYDDGGASINLKYVKSTNKFQLNLLGSFSIFSSVMSFKPNDKIPLGITWDRSVINLYVHGVKYSSSYGIYQGLFNVGTLTIGDGGITQSADGYIEELKVEYCTFDQAHIINESRAERQSVK